MSTNKLAPSDWEHSGNTVMDMIANAVSHFRKCRKPLKSIALHGFLYHKFENFISKKMNNEEEFETAREAGFKFDSVDIIPAGMMQTSNLHFTFWEREEDEK